MFKDELDALAPLITSSSENLKQFLTISPTAITETLIRSKIEDSLMRELMKLNPLEDLD